jgi:enamine deaminase RidA (YjgF/YER057c/UK114 family)
MSDRENVIPEAMKLIPERLGYVPAVKVGAMLFCSGQIGRTAELEVIVEPEQQFIAAWENLRIVLAGGGCTYEDVVEMTTYHVDIAKHMALYRNVRDRLFPGATCAWTAIGVSALAHPALLLEIKCVAVQRSAL